MRFKKDDALRMAVFQNVKVFPLQAGDGMIFSIGYHHVDEHLAYRGFDGRLTANIVRFGGSWLLRNRAERYGEGRASQGDNNQAGKADQQSRHSARPLVRILSLRASSHRDIVPPGSRKARKDEIHFRPTLFQRDVIDLSKYPRHNGASMACRSPLLRGLLCFSLLLSLSSNLSANKKKPPAKPVNINKATSEELQQVPGIGPATAQKILQMRKSYGPFKSVDDLLAIRGLGQKRLDKMRKYLTVGIPAQPKKSPNAAPAPQAHSNQPPPSRLPGGGTGLPFIDAR